MRLVLSSTDFGMLLNVRIEGNRIYIPAVYVLNKIDAISIEEIGICAAYPSYQGLIPGVDLLYKIPNSVPISVKMWLNIDELSTFGRSPL